MVNIIKPRPLGYCPARNVSAMLVHQVHIFSRHITATDIVSTILTITEIRSAFHQTMSIRLYQLGHDFIDKNLSQPTSSSLCLCQCAILVHQVHVISFHHSCHHRDLICLPPDYEHNPIGSF